MTNNPRKQQQCDEFSLLNQQKEEAQHSFNESVHGGPARRTDADHAREPEEAAYRTPRTFLLNTPAAKFTLVMALKQMYTPHLLWLEGKKKKRHSSFEYAKITEQAFWHTLDVLWANESFRAEMSDILQEYDQHHGRNTYQRLLSGFRPRNKFDPYECQDPSVLTVPRWYQSLKHVQSPDGIRQAIDYLSSLSDFAWIALNLEGAHLRRNGVYEPCETIQFATKDESFVIDARACKAHVPMDIFCRFLSMLFTKSTLFGFDFEQDDRERIMALIDGVSDLEVNCRATISQSFVYNVRRLVDRTYNMHAAEEDENQNDGPDREQGLPNYVRDHPRLSHYVHHITQKKLCTAYVHSIWNIRPLLEEQLSYAHMHAICIVLLLLHCTKMPAGREAVKDWFGYDSLVKTDIENLLL